VIRVEPTYRGGGGVQGGLPEPAVFQTCDKHGLRKYPSECSHCHGEGYVDAVDWQDADEYGQERCWTCGGTGETVWLECEWCEMEAASELEGMY
jgi:DnaJ-class molecular chaperone